ncbi:MAG: ABC transporter ATP-binding protein [Actinomycetota bacterium]|jgi:branched-chain amino acid transport system ATP-binding protein
MSQPLLVAENVTASYGPVTVLRGVTLVADEGELVTVLGANGSGKSTLLSAIVGLLSPRAGRVTFAGQDITGRPPEAIARQRLVMVPEGRQLFGPMSVLDNLLLGAHCRHRNRRAVADGLERVFSLFPVLRERSRLPAASLSGGQQQMLAIGRALMAEPKMLLLDEPSLGLAPLVTRQLFETLRVLHDAGVSILLVEQNARMALDLADRAYVMERGSVTVEGPAARMLEDERVRAAYLGLGSGGAAP